MPDKQQFLELLKDSLARFPKARRFCYKHRASVRLDKLEKQKCWDCPHYILQEKPSAICDPL